MFVCKNEDINKIKDKIYYELKKKFPSYRFGMKYYKETENQPWDWMIVNILSKGLKESELREIDELCFSLQKMRNNERINVKGLVDYIESEYDNKPINQLEFS